MTRVRSIDGLLDQTRVVHDFDALLDIYKKEYIDNEDRAFKKLNAFNKRYPLAKQSYKSMQALFLKSENKNGVFCTIDQLKDISPSLLEVMSAESSKDRGYSVTDDPDGNKRFRDFYPWFFTFGTWRNSLGVYRLDPDIYTQSISSIIPSDTPTTIFSRLPDWCVYIELPSKQPMQIINDCVPCLVLGFWVLLNTTDVDGTDKLVVNIVFDMMPSANSPNDNFVPITLIIDDNLTVEQSIKSTYEESAEGYTAEQQAMMAQELEQMTKVLSLILWLCAEEPDISNINGEPVSGHALREPKYGINKKTGGFIPPNHPKIYDIGKRLGGEVREFNEKNDSDESALPVRRRPHIRRGHWHGVWRGTGQNKNFHLYWQPALFVNSTTNQHNN